MGSRYSVLAAQPLFEGATGFGEEQLKGKPKVVRVEREKFGEKSVRLPEQDSFYREDGNLSSSKRYVARLHRSIEYY